MHELDETDLEILELLGEDARRPYSEIADRVDLSGPAVSDRVDRLREAGVIEGFTVEIDRSQLQAGAPVVVDVASAGAETDAVRSAIAELDAVEHLFVAADGDISFVARPPGRSVRRWLDEELPSEVTVHDVTLLDEVHWTPSIGGSGFALSCAECGNTVDSEGEQSTIDGDRYHFCCGSCLERFEKRHGRIAEGA